MASVSAGLAGIQAEDLECPVCFSIPRATSSASPAGGRLRRVVSHVPRLLPPSSQPSHHQHLRRAIDLKAPRAYVNASLYVVWRWISVTSWNTRRLVWGVRLFSAAPWTATGLWHGGHDDWSSRQTLADQTQGHQWVHDEKAERFLQVHKKR